MRELYGSANYYGIGDIVKKYAKFPVFLPFPVAIQHGWSNFANKHDACFDASENWYWSNRIEQQYQQKFAGLNTRAVGSPFLYLLKLMGYREDSKQRRGSIVFPSHSANFVSMECDFEHYADLLDRLPDEYKPITVCVYHLDVDKGLDKPFADKGFEIVTNGTSIYETKFLENYILNTQNKKYAFSNQMTSALLFASAMGLKSFFHGPAFITKSTDPHLEGVDYNQYHRQWESEYRQYFAFPDCDLAAQQELAAKELGKDAVLSPWQMKWLLWRWVLTKPYLKYLTHRLHIFLASWLRQKFPFLFRYRDTFRRNIKNLKIANNENSSH